MHNNHTISTLLNRPTWEPVIQKHIAGIVPREMPEISEKQHQLWIRLADYGNTSFQCSFDFSRFPSSQTLCGAPDLVYKNLVEIRLKSAYAFKIFI